MDQFDLAIVGAGAAGLFAAIWAARTNPNLKIIALDSAKRIGAKILISGGGRCNITHDSVDEKSFAGSTPAAIRKVLRRFSAEETIHFFETLGVRCKVEPTGKIFPISDRAQTVVHALLSCVNAYNVKILSGHRVETIASSSNGFILRGNWGELKSGRIILSTGGKSVPETGSDGHGYEMARAHGHGCTQRVFPALVPLVLPQDHFTRGLAGISASVTLEVRSGSMIQSFDGSLLCTHFGISGPVVLDISRYLIDARFSDPDSKLVVNWMPGKNVDAELLQLNRSSVGSWLRKQLPDRLGEALSTAAGVEQTTPGSQLTREDRRKLRDTLTRMELPVMRDRGFRYAEVTAGGIPLNELNLNTMESRKKSGLYLCGEICDVDGRIGGFNFQWAWASGYVAGISAAG